MQVLELAPRDSRGANKPIGDRVRRRLGVVLIPALALAWIVAAPVVGQVAAAGDPVIAAAGDIACDPADSHLNGGNGTGTYCAEKAVSNLLVGQGLAAVLPLGDDQYYCGSLAAFRAVYDPTWGRVKSITHPVVGNHEYLTSGGSTSATGCDPTNSAAAGYFNYYGAAAGSPGQGYYSYNIGAWHLIALNSNCGSAGGCNSKSPQGMWLAADLAAHQNQCLLAYWHIPLFSSGGRANSNSRQLWDALYAAHADVVLNGHDHIYERFAPQTPAGLADPVNGIRQFTVGTGGANHTSIAALAANSVVRDTTSFGVLKLTLHAGSYNWQFQNATGSFTDSGSASCHKGSTAPTPTPIGSPAPTSTPAGGLGTFTPVADSYVDASAPTTNHGTTTSLRVDATPVDRSYIRFNVAGLTGPATSATLRVWANSSQSAGYDAFSVADNTWLEKSIVDSNAPPFGARLGSSGAVAKGSWTSVNVTSAVKGNGLVSFGLSTTSGTALSLSSREGPNQPQLVVTGAGLASVVPPSMPGAPDRLPAVAFLFVPLLLPGLMTLDRLRTRRTFARLRREVRAE